MWMGANFLLPALVSFSCWNNVSTQLCICRKLIEECATKFVKDKPLSCILLFFSCSSWYSFYSLHAVHHNPPIGFIFYHFEIQSLISQLRSGAWRWETFIIFHLCNSSESASPFQKACNSIYSHECCILLLRMVVHEFIVSKGILMCPSCIYMQDMFCISDKKISIFWCLKSLLGILF